MYVSDLRIRDFRCFERCDLQPGRGVNLIVGDNASGKSSLLEALFFLGRGHSFRPGTANRCIRHGAPFFTLNAAIETEQKRRVNLGIQREPAAQRIKLDSQENVARYELVSSFPLQVIDPTLHRLLEDGPQYRRRYLDWGVFHVEQGFYPAWRRYQRALRQRNGALRAGAPKTSVIAWDNELVQSALVVDSCRRGYVDALSKLMPEMVGAILGEGKASLEYHPGWGRDEDMGGALARTLEADQRSGYTHVGPHRGDLRVRVGSVAARDWVSRGQQKVITAVLLLSQAALLDNRRQIRPVLLIDDLAAEMGAPYRRAVIDMVQRLKGQCFMSFLDETLIPDNVIDPTMFHVEHGVVSTPK